MKKRIRISHIHVWDKKNKGDAGIVLAVQELLKEKLGNNIEIFDFPIEALKEAKSEALKKINSSNLVIIGGGGIFYSYFTPFSKKVIDLIKVPLVVFGVGYIREVGGRKLSKEEIESIVYLCDKSHLIGVRDNYTRKFLIENKAKAKKIKIVGDPGIFLKEKKVEDFSTEDRVKIGFNLNYSGWLGFGKWENDILDSYNKTIEHFSKNNKAEIYYLVHHPGEYNIFKKLKADDLKVIDLSMGEQKYVYSQLDLVIGMMLHSCVMSFGALTPEINVAYDLRNKSFARFIKCPELVISLEDLKSGKLLKTSKRVFAKRKSYRNKFARTKKRIFKKIENFLEEINNLVK